jgi:hypothetical protein
MQNDRKLRYASCVMGTDDLRGLVRLSVQFGIVYDLGCYRQQSCEWLRSELLVARDETASH